MMIALAACAQSSSSDTSVSQTDATTAVTETTATTETVSETTPPPAAAGQEKASMSAYENKVAEVKTSAGDIHIRFFPDIAPNHVKNFIDLAQQGYYNGTKFHRIIPGFMIQGGDPNTKSGDPSSWGIGGSGKHVKAEFSSVPHRRGIVSMARANDPDSASSQFFIVTSDSTFLDNKYSVFGQVTKGMDVADKIVNAPKGARDVPNDPVSIVSITIRDARDDEKGAAPK
jgi:peptidyl-prolyl cis-trans isomerase B (cyclophilin B)